MATFEPANKVDPVTTVWLAAAVLTFIDFSHKLTTGSLETIGVGTTTDVGHAKGLVDDLEKVTKALEVEFLGASEHEEALRRLARGCKSFRRALSNTYPSSY